MTYRPRKSRFTREQWEVQRERFHIDPESPMPAEGTAVNISKPVGSLIASLGLAQQSLQHQLMERWENIAGSPLCRHIRPGPSQEGTLTIYVSNSVMLTELSRFQGTALLKNIQKALPDAGVNKLKFLIDPDTRAMRR